MTPDRESPYGDDYTVVDDDTTQRFIAKLPAPLNRIATELTWIIRVILSAFDRFYSDNGFSRAASLAYTSLLSLFPITAMVFGVLAAFAVSNDNISRVREFVFRQFVPSAQVVDKVLLFMEDFGRAVTDPSSSFNLLAFGFLTFTSILLINSIESVLNEIWQVFEPRSITDKIAIFSAVLLLAPILAVSAFYFARLRIDAVMGDGVVLRAYTLLLPYLFDFAAFFALNYLVPKAPVKVFSAMIGAALSSLLFGAAKSGFAIYVEQFASYDKLYGALAAIPVFLIWLYVSWSIVLLGAEAAYQAQYLPRIGRIWRRSALNVGDARMVLALQALTMVAQAFRAGGRLPNELDVAQGLGCSSTVLKPILYALEKQGIITKAITREGPLTLLRAPEMITLREIRDALFHGISSVRYAGELATVLGIFRDKRSLRDTTLAMVLDSGSDVPLTTEAATHEM
jgi:membrane protein